MLIHYVRSHEALVGRTLRPSETRGSGVSSPIGPPAVDVFQVVLDREPPAREDTNRLPHDVRIGRERGDTTTDEARCLGEREVRVDAGAIAPRVLGDPKVLEHGFGSEETRCHRDSGRAVFAKL